MNPGRCDSVCNFLISVDNMADNLKDRRNDSSAACRTKPEKRRHRVPPLPDHQRRRGIRSRLAIFSQSERMRVPRTGAKIIIVEESKLRVGNLGAEHRLDRLSRSEEHTSELQSLRHL